MKNDLEIIFFLRVSHYTCDWLQSFFSTSLLKIVAVRHQNKIPLKKLKIVMACEDATRRLKYI